MTCKPSLAAALVVMAALGGCASKNVAPSTFVSDAPTRVAAADWSKAETVTVTLSNFRFTPDHLEFRHDMPYRLHLVNQSGGAHDFTSEGFFKAIAVQKVEPSPAKGTAGSPATSVDLAGGEQKDLYFVAVTPGVYGFDCSELLHDTLGMTGEITIR